MTEDDDRPGTTDDDRSVAAEDGDRSLRERANDLAEELAGAVEGPADRDSTTDEHDAED